jgi:hypothetical protein
MLRSAMVGAAMAAVVLTAGPSVTPADIEKATGLKGVHEVPETAPGAVTGRDNYADATGRVVLWFQTMNRTGFIRAKGQPAKLIRGVQSEPALHHSEVAGLGDEAFDGPDGKTQYAIYVRKGDEAFGLISNLDRTGKPFVTMEHLRLLAKTIVSKI